MRSLKNICATLWERSWIWRVVLVVTGLMFQLTLFYLVENMRGWHAWESYRKTMEAKGEHLTRKPFIPPPIPDDQNLAMAPLLKPMFEFERVDDGVPEDPGEAPMSRLGRLSRQIHWKDTNGLERLNKITFHLNRYSSSTYLFAVERFRPGFANLECTRDFFFGNTNFPQPTVRASDGEDIVLAMSYCDSQINELMAESLKRPLCRFPVNYLVDWPNTEHVQHHERLKNIVKALRIRIVAKADACQPDAAYNELKLSFRLADSLQEEPLVRSLCSRLDMMHISLHSFREGLARHAWNAAQLEELQNYFASKDLMAEYQRSIRWERAQTLESVDWFRRHRFGAFGGDPKNGVNWLDAGNILIRIMPSGWWEQNKLTIARMFQEVHLSDIHAAKGSFHPMTMREANKLVRENGKAPFGVFARFLVGGYNGFTPRCAESQTYLDAAQVACALERYRLANGQLPARLSDLVFQFASTIPKDIEDGRPLRYRLLPNNGYLLYSVGENQIDDGGVMCDLMQADFNDRPIVGEGKKLFTRDSGNSDWVWVMPGDYRLLMVRYR